MKLNANNENGVAKLEVILTGEELKPYIDKEITKKIATIEADGFRKGKMPVEMFIKKYGVAAVYPDVVDTVLNEFYPSMIQDNELDVVAAPEFDFENLKISEEGLELNGTVDLMPIVEVDGYAAVKDSIKKEEVKITAKEVKDEIATLLEDKAVMEVKEGAAVLGDIVVFDFDGYVDGEAFDGGKAENHTLTLGSGQFIPGFEEQLVGTTEGQKLDVVVPFPVDYHAENLAGKEATFKCEIHEIKTKVLPRLTKAVIEEIEGYKAESKAELEIEIKEKLSIQKNEQTLNKYNNEVITKLIELANFAVPKSMIAQETDQALENFKKQIAGQGIEYSMYLQMMGGSEETIRAQIDIESERRIAEMLIMGAVIKAEKFEVSDEEVESKIAEFITQTGMSEEEIIQALGGDKNKLKNEISYDKAYKLVLGE